MCTQKSVAAYVSIGESRASDDRAEAEVERGAAAALCEVRPGGARPPAVEVERRR